MREELGLSLDRRSPRLSGAATGMAYAFGAAMPTLPYGCLGESVAFRASIVAKTHDDAGSIVGEAGEKLKGDVAEARAKIVTESEALARLAAERILGRPV